jgi:hypothetical protein
LLPSLANRERDAFEAVMRQHNGRLFRVARAILKDDTAAEDALQDAYLVRTRLFRARARLRASLAADLDAATSDVFGFAGDRCDRIVASVLSRYDFPTMATSSRA